MSLDTDLVFSVLGTKLYKMTVKLESIAIANMAFSNALLCLCPFICVTGELCIAAYVQASYHTMNG